MSRSPALESLLIDIRQHPAFQELLRSVDKPRMPRYRPSSKATIDEMGARSVFESGRLGQDNRWRTFLTGVPHDGEEPTSEQEQS